jgi:hypothetical protein
MARTKKTNATILEQGAHVSPASPDTQSVIGSNFSISSTPTEMQSMSKSGFECFASTGVNTPAASSKAQNHPLTSHTQTPFGPRSSGAKLQTTKPAPN